MAEESGETAEKPLADEFAEQLRVFASEYMEKASPKVAMLSQELALKFEYWKAVVALTSAAQSVRVPTKSTMWPVSYYHALATFHIARESFKLRTKFSVDQALPYGESRQGIGLSAIDSSTGQLVAHESREALVGELRAFKTKAARASQELGTLESELRGAGAAGAQLLQAVVQFKKEIDGLLSRIR